MLLPRIIITFTLGPLAVYLIYLGGWFYFVPLAGILLLATFEYEALMAKLGWRSPWWLLVPAVVAQWFLPAEVQQHLLALDFITFEGWPDLVAPALLVALFGAMFYSLWLYEKREGENAPGAWLATTMGIVFLGWLGSHFFRVRALETTAVEWTALAMLGTWVADSGAYVFGKRFGTHKLSPRLSPNKTIEGYVGGIIVGVLFVWLIGVYLFELPLAGSLLLGSLVSIISPAGDLGISLLKREAEVKDSGNFLPGHGGALDRIDSLVWSVALAYYLALLIN